MYLERVVDERSEFCTLMRGQIRLVEKRISVNSGSVVEETRVKIDA